MFVRRDKQYFADQFDMRVEFGACKCQTDGFMGKASLDFFFLMILWTLINIFYVVY